MVRHRVHRYRWVAIALVTCCRADPVELLHREVGREAVGARLGRPVWRLGLHGVSAGAVLQAVNMPGSPSR